MPKTTLPNFVGFFNVKLSNLAINWADFLDNYVHNIPNVKTWISAGFDKIFDLVINCLDYTEVHTVLYNYLFNHILAKNS